MAPLGRASRLAFRAAGFMATSTLGASPGRGDVVVGDVDLEGRHPGQRAGRGPDLGREVGEGGQVVAEQGRRGGEAVAGELHAVARVAGEPDDDAVEQVGGLRVGRVSDTLLLFVLTTAGCLR